MKLKGYHPHKGRAFLEPDRRIVELVRSAAVIHGLKQDEIMANALLACFEDEKNGPLKLQYEAVAKALKDGELKRKQYKRPRAALSPDGETVMLSTEKPEEFKPWEN